MGMRARRRKQARQVSFIAQSLARVKHYREYSDNPRAFMTESGNLRWY